MAHDHAQAPPELVLERMALFLDYDGTLVDIAPTPEAAHADAGLVELLAGLQARLDGALAVVTGRPVADVDDFLAPLRLSLAALHGLELRLQDGTMLDSPVPQIALERVRAAFAELVAAHPGTRLEDKRLSVALHYRQAPEAAERVDKVAAALAEASRGELRLLRGKMVVEILPAGVDKGRAIEALLAIPPFAGRTPVFVGDDVTDEAGFRAVNARDGLSVRIGGGVATEARHRLPDHRALRRWLGAALGQEGPALAS